MKSLVLMTITMFIAITSSYAMATQPINDSQSVTQLRSGIDFFQLTKDYAPQTWIQLDWPCLLVSDYTPDAPIVNLTKGTKFEIHAIRQEQEGESGEYPMVEIYLITPQKNHYRIACHNDKTPIEAFSISFLKQHVSGLLELVQK